ncbi:MAG TPA: hypothetical protein VGP26_24475 [Actinophytocola sp.]|jgi:hypothetical protein|nr:hypothetical protein [Actinophytocola sp.]
MTNPIHPLDVDDTTRCPRADQCAYCETPASAGAALGVELDVATIATPVGVLCLTICAACVDANRLPALSYPAAMQLVLAHCEHLGCDLEDMAAAKTLR